MAGCPKDLKQWWLTLKPAHAKTYSDYLWAAREAEKEESMELSWNPQSQAIDNTAKPKLLVSSLCRGSRGISQYLKQLLCALHTWKRKVPREEEEEIKDPDTINRVTEEFMVCQAWAMKDAQVGGKVLLSLQQPQALHL